MKIGGINIIVFILLFVKLSKQKYIYTPSHFFPLERIDTYITPENVQIEIPLIDELYKEIKNSWSLWGFKHFFLFQSQGFFAEAKELEASVQKIHGFLMKQKMSKTKCYNLDLLELGLEKMRGKRNIRSVEEIVALLNKQDLTEREKSRAFFLWNDIATKQGGKVELTYIFKQIVGNEDISNYSKEDLINGLRPFIEKFQPNSRTTSVSRGQKRGVGGAGIDDSYELIDRKRQNDADTPTTQSTPLQSNSPSPVPPQNTLFSPIQNSNIPTISPVLRPNGPSHSPSVVENYTPTIHKPTLPSVANEDSTVKGEARSEDENSDMDISVFSQSFIPRMQWSRDIDESKIEEVRRYYQGLDEIDLKKKMHVVKELISLCKKIEKIITYIVNKRELIIDPEFFEGCQLNEFEKTIFTKNNLYGFKELSPDLNILASPVAFCSESNCFKLDSPNILTSERKEKIFCEDFLLTQSEAYCFSVRNQEPTCYKALAPSKECIFIKAKENILFFEDLIFICKTSCQVEDKNGQIIPFLIQPNNMQSMERGNVKEWMYKAAYVIGIINMLIIILYVAKKMQECISERVGRRNRNRRNRNSSRYRQRERERIELAGFV